MESKKSDYIFSSKDIALMIFAIEECEPLIPPNTVINGIDINSSFATAKIKLTNGDTVFDYNESSAMLTALQQLRDTLQHKLSSAKSGSASHKVIKKMLTQSNRLISVFIKIRK